MLHGGEAARLEQFFTLWTLKESYVKMTGHGVSLPLNEFSIHRSDTGEYAVHTQAGRVAGVYPAASDRLVQYKLAACGHTRPRFENLEILPAESLLRT
jgi:4'-phosphopantetheinyl transferase